MLSSFSGWLISLPRRRKRVLLGLFDGILLFLALRLSYSMRLGFDFSPSLVQFSLMVLAPLIALPILYRLGFYRVVVRYVTEATVWTTVKALAIAISLWLGIVYMTELQGVEGVPRSIPVLFFAISVVLLSGTRFMAKWLLGAAVERAVAQRRMLIYGAGPVGRQLAAALKIDPTNKPVGFIEDEATLHGAEVAGLRVYEASDVVALVEALQVNEIVVCSDAVDQKSKSELFRRLAKSPVRIGFLPTVAAGWGGDLVSRIRDIGIADLLGRSMVAPDPQILGAAITGKTVFVSGAGGSIGSELCRQIVSLEPAALILFEIDEFALYEIERSLRGRRKVEIHPVLGSVTDRAAVWRQFEARRIDTVFHAAAYKHVPLVERNALAGITNNVLGSWIMAEAAFEHDVQNFVLISTDKAVRPSNVMGATKRWAELIVRSFAFRAEGPARRFCSVRFGNVIGSQGSVVPLFKEQIETGGPVTLTDENMTRYFMATSEAVELIIQAAALSEGGEIFLLDMGEPVRIRDLAETMIRLAGLSVKDANNPDGDIAIEITGIRPGEKIVEELLYDPSAAEHTIHPKISYGKMRHYPNDDMREAVDRLSALAQAGAEKEAVELLFEFIERDAARKSF